jgi:hypothetical protein
MVLEVPFPSSVYLGPLIRRRATISRSEASYASGVGVPFHHRGAASVATSMSRTRPPPPLRPSSCCCSPLELLTVIEVDAHKVLDHLPPGYVLLIYLFLCLTKVYRCNTFILLEWQHMGSRRSLHSLDGDGLE